MIKVGTAIIAVTSSVSVALSACSRNKPFYYIGDEKGPRVQEIVRQADKSLIAGEVVNCC